MKKLLSIASMIAVFTYCGPSGSFDNGKQINSKDVRPPGPPSPSPAPSPSPSPSPGNNSGPGESFFNLTVKPAFEGCSTGAACHKSGGPGFQGVPFDYQKAKALLDGSDAKSSRLYQKMRGKPTHGGGDKCLAGDDATPCKEVQEWWAKENGSGGGGGGTATNTAPNTSTGTGSGGLRGEAFFTATVLPKLATCNGCHDNLPNAPRLDYAGAKTRLKDGSGRANNLLINKPSLANGVRSHHSVSTKYCNDINNDSPCKEFQAWYDVEPR